jgi:hypothetical protein
MDQCYLCGEDASTVEQVPPPFLFAQLPTNIIQLPACQRCNGDASLDEQYLCTILSAMGYLTSAAAREVREEFQRRPRGSAAQLAAGLSLQAKALAGRIVGRLPRIGLDGERAQRVVRKIARGLVFHDCGKRLADNEVVLFRDTAAKLHCQAFTQDWAETDMGEAFRYRAQHDVDGSFIWLEFYRTRWWLALTEEHARTYARRPGSAGQANISPRTLRSDATVEGAKSARI